ncbi:hypothetical protein EON81_09635 [bacterium]|nr:MAG: hypothetical protein EON81_09635 [bacterium]
MVPEPPPIQALPKLRVRSPLMATLAVALPVAFLLMCGLKLRGCMTEHSRQSHYDFTFDMSPDGRTLVFAGVGQGGRDLYLFDLKSRRVSSLTATRDYEICPSFSHDGKRLVFTRGTPGVRADQLCVMDLATREVRQITDADENVTNPAFFPDGWRVLCTIETEYRWGGLASSWNESGELRVVDLQTGKQEAVITPKVNVSGPRFSADGKWIAWSGWREGADGGVYISPATDPNHAAKVLPPVSSLALNADGTKIVFSEGDYSSDHKIYISDRLGKNRRLISGSEVGCFDPVFSPNGKHVYFSSETSFTGGTGKTLMRSSTAGDEVIQIAPYTLFENPLGPESF